MMRNGEMTELMMFLMMMMMMVVVVVMRMWMWMRMWMRMWMMMRRRRIKRTCCKYEFEYCIYSWKNVPIADNIMSTKCERCFLYNKLTALVGERLVFSWAQHITHTSSKTHLFGSYIGIGSLFLMFVGHVLNWTLIHLSCLIHQNWQIHATFLLIILSHC
jgi:hypothetical protein